MRTSGSRTVLDSTVAIAILNDDDGFGSWAEAFEEIFLPVPAIGELRFGALHSGRTVENLRKVNALLSRCRILEVRLETTDAYARLRLHLRKKGRPIPENDLWIAALCVEHGLPLATTDGHFDEFDNLVEFEPLPL
jgi:tRNA(fMet)-specific endonuclease VapC